MTEWAAVATGIGGFLLAVAGFFIARIAAAKADGANYAVIKTDIEYIKTSVGEIKEVLKETSRDHDESIRRLHKRIDEHEKRITVIEQR